MNNSISIIGGADGPTSIFLGGSLGISWLNIFGLILVVLLLVPNIIYAVKEKNQENKCTNKLMNLVEQIGRYASMFLMVFNIGLAEVGFSSVGAFIVYMLGNILLMISYWTIWVLYFKKKAYWKQNTDSPYTQMYTREEKISRLNTDIAPYEHFVMAGSMSSFHYAFDDMFKMMVFLYVEPDIRIQRVHKRAIERFGRRVLEGGDMYESHMKFLKDNRSYEEDGSPNMREQKEWMTNMSCVKIELDGATDLESNADIIVNNWSGIVE